MDYDSQGRVRLRLQKILVQPAVPPAGPMQISLFVGDSMIYGSSYIGRGKLLEWTEPIYCDVFANTQITLHITEKNIFGRKKVIETLDLLASCLINASGAVCVTDNQQFKVTLTVATDDVIDRAYGDAVAYVQGLQTRLGRSTEQVARFSPFDRILSLTGPFIAGHPCAKPAYTRCVEAYKRIKRKGTRYKELTEFIASLSNTLPQVDLAEVASEAIELAELITSLLRVTEDAFSLVIDVIAGAWADFATPAGFSYQSGNLLTQAKQFHVQLDAGIVARTLSCYSPDDALLLRALQPTLHARYDPRQGCLAGTRSKVTEYIKTWCQTDSQDSRMLWMYDQLGTGKTAVAASVCQEFASKLNPTLAASFFCKRNDSSLGNPESVLKTLLSGLVARCPPLGKMLADTLRNNEQYLYQWNNGLSITLPEEVFEKMGELVVTDVLVVVVDAVDECGTEVTRATMLQTLRKMCQRAFWLRVIITSRGDPSTFMDRDQSSSSSITSFNIGEHNASFDISVLFQTKLNGVFRAEKWSAREMDQLAKHSEGLFLLASEACEYILGGSNHTERLQHLIDDPESAEHPRLLDPHFTHWIETTIGKHYAEDPHNVSTCLAAIAGTFLDGLALPAFLAVTSRFGQPDVLVQIIKSLGLSPPASGARGGAICALHLSFCEFLADPVHSGQFCVDMGAAHQVLAQGCLDIMMEQLRFNICGLQSSHTLNRDVLDLEARVTSSISPELAYSCTYWAVHFCKGPVDKLDQELVSAVRDFMMGPTLLYWIEALSLLNRLERAPALLYKLARVTANNSVRTLNGLVMGANIPNTILEVMPCAEDAYRFVMTFMDVISQSTPHLYTSALAMAPTGSLISYRLQQDFPNIIRIHHEDDTRVVSGCEDGSLRVWDAVSGARLVEVEQAHANSVSCVCFAPSGRFLVTGSHDNTLKVWDSNLRSMLQAPLHRHSAGVTCVSHSPARRYLASGSHDRTILLWDTRTWKPLGEPLRGHTAAISSVAFCSTGRLVVSGSWDKTVRIWDVDTGTTLYKPLVGHSLSVSSVAFAPDGILVASGSWDGTVKIWSAGDGKCIHTLANSNDGAVSCIALSSDGQRIACGSPKRDIKIWDIKSGEVTGKVPIESDGVCSAMRYSSDGTRLVAGSSDTTVRIWDSSAITRTMATGHNKLPKIATAADDLKVSPIPDPGASMAEHANSMGSRSSSPEGRLVSSASDDDIVGIWDAETGAALGQSLTGHSSLVLSVAFSPDGRRIVSGSEDKTLRMWDAETGAALGQSLTGHSSSVESVGFSPDGRRIVSGSYDKTLRMWDAETGAALGQPLTGHSKYVWSVVFSPDGRRIVSGSWDKTLRMWDAETGAALGQPLTGHYSYVLSVAFSPDGRRVVSGSADSTLRIWDVSSSSLHSLPASSLVQKTEDNGWVVGIEGTHLLWLPAEYRQHTPTYLSSNTRTQRRDVLLDLSRFKHGDSWAEVVGEASKMS